MPVAVPVTTAAAPVADAPERAIVREVNRQRHRFGLRRVRLTRSLNRAATRHSRLMLRADVLTHDGTHGTPFAARIRRSVRFARRQDARRTAAGLGHRGPLGGRPWMASPPHRATLLDGRFRRIDVGHLRGGWRRRRRRRDRRLRHPALAGGSARRSS